MTDTENGLTPAGPHGTRPAIAARDITAALRSLYADAKITTRAHPDGTATVQLPALCARYLGIGRDTRQVAAWISVYAPYGVQVISVSPDDCAVTLARVNARPADPRTSAGVPAYATAAEVTGQWPANRSVAGLITLAIAAGCRPHVMPHRSPHGRRYRVSLWHVDPGLLHGVIDVMEDSGRFAGAWYSWGRGDERRTGDPAELRQQLTSARDLHRARTSAAGAPRQLAGADFPGPGPASSQARRSGPRASAGRPARAAAAAQQNQPRSRP